MKFLIIAVIVLSLVFGYFAGHSDGYRDGQIDAAGGRIHYRLERQEDGSQTWAKCPDVCEARPEPTP